MGGSEGEGFAFCYNTWTIHPDAGGDAVKKTGILNAEIAAVVARLGHMDTLTVGDAGLPIPAGPQRIDLVVKPGLPGFLDVLDVILGEMVVEKAIIAAEMESVSPDLHRELVAVLGPVPVESVPHEAFKHLTQSSRAVVRTGEFTPYANVILVAGVAF
jgi:D-ribose pyranase